MVREMKKYRNATLIVSFLATVLSGRNPYRLPTNSQAAKYLSFKQLSLTTGLYQGTTSQAAEKAVFGRADL